MEPEPQAADRRGKKRRRELPRSSLLPTEEFQSPGTGGVEFVAEEPPPEAGRDEEEGIDHISNLPGSILEEIVSLLPTKDGARTQILSSQWRPIWCRAPLNLDLFDVFTDCESLTDVITHIISNHKGPARLFKVPWYYNHYYPDTVESWLKHDALRDLQEIDFCNSSNGPVLDPLPPPPASTFRFSSSLLVATLHSCSLPDDIAETIRFPHLMKLALVSVSISEVSLHKVIAACPALECLLVDNSNGFRSVRIKSASLISVGVHATYPSAGLEEIIIENAAHLKSFLYFQWGKGLRVSVISAPKLETLGCHFHHDNSSRLVFGSTVIEGLRVPSSTTVLPTVKTLAVNMHSLCLDMIIYLMKCFPSLEKLYVQPYYAGGSNKWRRKHRQLIRSLDIHLKKVVMFEYRGTKKEVDFATFFILNAKMLETMRFEGGPNNNDERFVAKQHEKLQLEKRASLRAQFRFITDACYHDISHIKDVHALSHADPFECRYCH